MSENERQSVLLKYTEEVGDKARPVRAAVFEKPIGKRNYMVNELIQDSQDVMFAMADLVKEMKEHKHERDQILLEIERLKKFASAGTVGAERKIAERENALRQDFQSYAASFIDLLARLKIASVNYDKQLISTDSLTTAEKNDVRAFAQAVLALYPHPIQNFLLTAPPGAKHKVVTAVDVKTRINAALGLASPEQQKTLLADMGFKQQATEIALKNKTMGMFATGARQAPTIPPKPPKPHM